MITLPELKSIAKELKIDSEGLSFDELKEVTDEYIRLYIKKRLVSADNMSDLLKEYLYTFFQVVFQDRYGNLYDHKGNKVGKRKGYDQS